MRGAAAAARELKELFSPESEPTSAEEGSDEEEQ